MEVDVNDETQINREELSSKELLRNDMLDHLSKNTDAHFKSQQRDEPELSDSEKRVIAESVLKRNCGTFLARFGNYLREDHLAYFEDCSENERYEVDFYLKRIRAFHNKATSKVKVRNRRFEALKHLVNKGSYFSEYEMKKRNPLLYEQLIGKFLTEEEEKERTGLDTTNITFVNLLLEQYDRDQMKKLKKKQKEDENSQCEKENSDDETMVVDSNCDQNSSLRKTETSLENDDTDDNFNETPIIKTLWGEEMTEKSNLCDLSSSSKNGLSDGSNNESLTKRFDLEYKENEEEDEEEEEELSDDEKNLLMEEFRSSMFNSFLEGKDNDFDYDEVDRNSNYDDIDMREQDEQETYFDSETPEDFCSVDNSNHGHENSCPGDVNTNETNLPVCTTVNSDQLNEDRVIDCYVETLKDIENTEKLTSKMESLHH